MIDQSGKTFRDDCNVSVIPHDTGGQQVGITSSTVRIVHWPTGITAECGEARSQFKNREIGMLMIQFALIELGFRSEYVK